MLQKNGWNQTLARFRARLDAEFDTLQNIRDGQPSGGLVPEMALAEVEKIVKDDLKRSVGYFFTAFSSLISLICQPGDSRFGISRLEKESAPGTWIGTSKAYCRQSARWNQPPHQEARDQLRMTQ